MTKEADKAPALGVSIRSQFPNCEVIFQTHFDREEDFTPKMKDLFKFVDERKAHCEIQAQIDEISQLEDEVRRKDLMIGDYNRHLELAVESAVFKIQEDIANISFSLRKLILEKDQITAQINKKNTAKNDPRYVPTEQASLDTINLNIEQAQAKLEALKAELESPDPGRAEMRNLKQTKLQIESAQNEKERLQHEIEKRVKLRDGLNKCSDN